MGNYGGCAGRCNRVAEWVMPSFRYLKTLLAVALAWASLAAHAGLTLLPGSSPQSTVIGELFPAPVRALVTDDDGRPVAGAFVHWYVVNWQVISVPQGINCILDLGEQCDKVTDANGIADLGRPFAISGPTMYTLTLTARDKDARFLGRVDARLETVLRAPLPLMERAGGDGQRAVLGTAFRDPLVVRLTRASGAPIVGATVGMSFEPYGALTLLSPQVRTTDEEGYVRFMVTATHGIGEFKATASWLDPESRGTARTTFSLTNTKADGTTDWSVQGMWWGGPAESGWGVAIAQQADRLFSVIFGYDDAGEPTWWVIPEGRWDAGLGSLYLAQVWTTRSAPFFDYDPIRFTASPFGYAHLDFGDSETEGQFRFMATQPGPSVKKRIERQDYSGPGPAPLAGLSGLWWGGESQDGWGVTIMQQPGGLFCVWLTYDESGAPTWFVMPSGAWNGLAWEGSLYRTTGSPFFGGPYDVSKFALAEVGRASIGFSNSEMARFSYTLGERRGSMAISKQQF